jgi:hypothetical protein
VPPQRIVPPDRTSAVPAIVAGTIGWLVALIVLIATGTHTWWRWVCLTGLLLGVLGIPVMSRYQRVHTKTT